MRFQGVLSTKLTTFTESFTRSARSAAWPRLSFRAHQADAFLQRLTPLQLAVLHVGIWTTFAYLASRGSLHHDMLEAYVWGREFQFGYHKHPPFWAWIAGLWFDVFPRTNLSFYFLATINEAVGLLGVYAVSARIMGRERGRLCMLLAMAIPFYSFIGLTYNANSIQLSILPWCAYYLVRVLETRSVRHAVMLGVLCGIGILSKYYVICVFASLLTAACLHPNRRAFFKSPAPWIAIATGLLIAAPHILWLFNTNFLTFEYARTRTAFPVSVVFQQALVFIFGGMAFSLGCVGLVMMAHARLRSAGARFHRKNAYIVALALGPFAFTLLAAALLNVRLSTKFAVGIYYLVPALAVLILRPNIAYAARAASWFVAALTVSALLAAPFVPHLHTMQRNRPDAPHIMKTAAQASAFWQDATGLPLRFVSGSDPYAAAVAFYAKGDISELIDFNPRHAPWVKESDVAQSGLLILCLSTDSDCVAIAETWATAASFSARTVFTHLNGPSSALASDTPAVKAWALQWFGANDL